MWLGEERRQQMMEPDKKGIKFDSTINLGHILTFLGFMVAGLAAWTTLDKRVVVLEENKKSQAQMLEKIDLKLDRLVEKRGN